MSAPAIGSARQPFGGDLPNQMPGEVMAPRGAISVKRHTTDLHPMRPCVSDDPAGAPVTPLSRSGAFGMTATATKALDLFSGAGGVTRGLMQAGFAMTGVDLRPQPRYCGGAFVQADALEYLATADLSAFNFIWASPPCQRFTALKRAPGAKATRTRT